MSRVWAQSTAKGGELLTMLALADHSDDAGESYPSIPTLAAKARLTERQTRRVLNKLEAAGEIRKQKSNGGRNRSNHYFITLSENPDKLSLTKLQGKGQNPDICDTETLTPASGAYNRHRTVNKERELSPKKKGDPRVKEFIDWWHSEYQRRFDAKYHVTGKDAFLVKHLLRSYELEKLQATATCFFETNDPWVLEHGGFTIGVFTSQVNKLVSVAGKSKGNQVTPENGKYDRLGELL
jgi:hypothetical protein